MRPKLAAGERHVDQQRLGARPRLGVARRPQAHLPQVQGVLLDHRGPGQEEGVALGVVAVARLGQEEVGQLVGQGRQVEQRRAVRRPEPERPGLDVGVRVDRVPPGRRPAEDVDRPGHPQRRRDPAPQPQQPVHDVRGRQAVLHEHREAVPQHDRAVGVDACAGTGEPLDVPQLEAAGRRRRTGAGGQARVGAGGGGGEVGARRSHLSEVGTRAGPLDSRGSRRHAEEHMRSTLHALHTTDAAISGAWWWWS